MWMAKTSTEKLVEQKLTVKELHYQKYPTLEHSDPVMLTQWGLRWDETEHTSRNDCAL